MLTQVMDTCYIRYSPEKLVVGNDLIERTWTFTSGFPIAASIFDKSSNVEWLATAKPAVCNLPGMGSQLGEPVIDVYDNFGVSAKALRVRIPFTHTEGKFEWTHLIYSSASFIRTYFTFMPAEGTPSATRSTTEAAIPQQPASNLGPIEHLVNVTAQSGPGTPQAGGNTRTGAGAMPASGSNNSTANSALPMLMDTLEAFTLSPIHVRWRTVVLRDVTDRHNNLVSVEEGLFYDSEKRSLQGNLMFFTDVLSGNGITVVKESATPLAHLNYPGYDFTLSGRELHVVGSGLVEHDLQVGETVTSYGVAVGVSQNGETGSFPALQEYHRCLRKPEPARDFFVMSNTWGDRSKDLRVSEAFILTELPVAAKMGITIYQIDDGWQKGATTASNPNGRWEGFHAADPAFWEPNPERFPNGLAPIAAKAKELGVRLGLWFAPDSDNHFIHWEADARILLDLFREHGVTHFKLDGVKLASKVGEERFIRMMQRVTERTNRQVTFNLDVTANVRLGYYGRNHYGNLFLENRYTDWHNYFPHRTLRNLWMLSAYFPTNRLQMEFLNVMRNQPKYADDPLGPATVGTAYAFGATACANPLAWMELTGLSAADQELLATMITSYRRHQEALLGSVILPIGQEPDGTHWSGFQCMVDDKVGYLAIYRERNKYTRYRFQLWQLTNCRLELEPVIGSGQERRLEVDARGETWVTMPHPMSFALYRYRRH